MHVQCFWMGDDKMQLLAYGVIQMRSLCKGLLGSAGGLGGKIGKKVENTHVGGGLSTERVKA